MSSTSLFLLPSLTPRGAYCLTAQGPSSSHVRSCLDALLRCGSDWLTCHFLPWAGRFLQKYKAQLGSPRPQAPSPRKVRAAWAWPTLAAPAQAQLGGRSLSSQWPWSRGQPAAGWGQLPASRGRPPARRGRPHQRWAWAHITLNAGPKTPRCPQRKSCQAACPRRIPATLAARLLRLQGQLKSREETTSPGHLGCRENMLVLQTRENF